MRRSRFMLLLLLPVYGTVMSLTLSVPFVSELDTPTWWVLALSNPITIVIMFSILLLRASEAPAYIIMIVSNLAFWLPVAHLTDVLLEKARRRRARRRG